MPVRIQDWNAEHYLFHVRQFLYRKFLETGKIGHRFVNGVFVPVIAAASVKDGAAALIAQTAEEGMREEYIAEFDKGLMQAWQAVMDVVALAENVDWMHVCEHFFTERYHSVMAETLHATLQTVMPPRSPLLLPVLPDVNASEGEKQRRICLLEQLSQEDVDAAEAKFILAWGEKVSSLPKKVREIFGANPPVKHWEQNVHPLLFEEYSDRVVGGSCTEEHVGGVTFSAARKGSPCASTSTFVSQSSELEASSLYGRKGMDPSAACSPARRGRKAASTATNLSQSSPEAERGEDVGKISAGVMSPIRRAGGSSGLAATGQRRTPHMEDSPSRSVGMAAVFADLQWEGTAVEGDDGPSIMLSSRKILEEECGGTRYVYEGVLVDFDPEAIRQIEPKGRSPTKRGVVGAASVKNVVDMLAADNTGGVLMTIWDDTIKGFVDLHRMGKAGQRLFRIENFRITKLGSTEWNGEILSNIRVIHSIPDFPDRPGTIVTALADASSPNIPSELFQMPNADVCKVQLWALTS